MIVNPAARDAGTARPTFWERAAATRWGRYLTRAELAMLELGCAAAGESTAALEVGAEGGRWSRWLIDRGWSMTCTDVDPEMVALCSHRLPKARSILVSPSDTTLPCESQSLGLLLVYEVASVVQSKWFASEAARVLRPGGVLVCNFYNSRSLRALASRVLHAVDARRRRYDDDAYHGGAYTEFIQRLRAHGLLPLVEKGLGWFPFTRQSNSALVPVCTAIEAALGLRRLPRMSPFVLLVAQRAG